MQRQDQRARLTFGIAGRDGDAVQDSPGLRRYERALKHGRRGGLAKERKECGKNDHVCLLLVDEKSRVPTVPGVPEVPGFYGASCGIEFTAGGRGRVCTNA